MLDLVVRGGTVVDGKGGAPRRADVGVAGGRIAAVAEPGLAAADLRGAGAVVDAEGLAVAPGFVDLHTHYDAQLFYDPGLSPSPLHGVTTVVAGNCGLTLAPVGGDADRSFLARLLARVESIPTEAVEQGVPFGWHTFGEFLDSVEAHGVGPNIGFLVGHSAVRRAVMGEDASRREASAEELAAMCRLLGESIAAGGMGFSTANIATQVDGDGRPTPPNFATVEELVALAAVCGEHPGTSIEFIPDSFIRGFSDDDVSLMAQMSAAANRPLNWNTPLVNRRDPDLVERQLRACDEAAAIGGRVVPMFNPQNLELQHDFLRGYVFRAIPGWGWLFDLDVDQRVEALRDPANRARLEKAAAEPTTGLAVVVRNWAGYRVNEVACAGQESLEGRSVADLASEWGTSPFEAMVEVAVRCHLRVGFVRRQYEPGDDWAFAARCRLLRDPRVVLQASDAGAHLDMMAGANFPTQCLAELVRERRVFSLEEMVRQLSSVPADLYGLVDRGRIVEGGWADLVVFDPATVAAGPLRTVGDLPGGGTRLTTGSVGVAHVLVAGRPVVEGGRPTGARPGRVLRSGRDTAAVAARPAGAVA